MAVQMIARRRVTYATRALRPGEKFEASAKDAAILAAIGAAAPDEPAPDPIPVVAEEELAAEQPQRQRRRQYRRRDMVAEGSDE